MSFHFSKRTNWEFSENQLSQELENLRAKKHAIIDLTESNPTRCGFDYPQELILSPLASQDNFSYTPHPKGMLRTREALVSYYGKKGVSLSPDEIVLTSSTSEGYSFLFRLLMEPGDKVLIPAPSYPLFSYLADINDVVIDHYFLRLEEGRWRINFESIEHALDKSVRAIILVSPNNPTGSFVKPEELDQLNALCQAHGIALICDEVFCDYIFEEYKADYRTLAGNAGVPTFVLGGMSKAMALPQMKLSWIVASGPKGYLQEALPRLEVIADAYLSVNTPVQNAAVEWFKNLAVMRDQIMARVVANYNFLAHAIKEAGVGECLVAEGGWYAAVRIPSTITAEALALQLLREDGVYVHPGYFFDFKEEGYLVFSLLPQRVVFEDGVERICRRLHKT